MKEQFIGFIGYSEEEKKELWEQALFVIDTNILINFYKYTSESSTKILFDILKWLKDEKRLWVPYQVGLEYFFNYEGNMTKQREGYTLLKDKFEKVKEDAEKILDSVHSKHPYILTEQFKPYIENVKNINEDIQEQLNQEIEKLPDTNDIHIEIMNLLDGVIGEPYSQEEIDKIEEQGRVRFKYKVPPGFEDNKDEKKKEYRTYGDVRYQQIYGDLIVWNQIIDKANDVEESKPIIFITEDRKEDWWEKHKKSIKRPHPQLLQEFYNKTTKKFYMYRTARFVENAKRYLNFEVTEEVISNVSADIENIREEVEDHEETEQFKESQFEIDSNIFSYLSNEEQIIFDNMVESTNAEGNSSVANNVYNNAIRWAYNKVISKLDRQIHDLIRVMSNFHNGYAGTALNAYNKLPNNPDDRIKNMTKIIRFLKDKIAWYEDQGY
ncbi:PIN-like domain-containing protein [Oceanobacillus halophilus]|uniref:PIN like domain-containing protein n=1 Tax=Oceanobacillus halophilus TaxID=930130 RepID=A0A494ZWR8_9BACI|nr:PIN-like domain-containing protein [Oceanobacillus halophilus]RKQ29322.1 hypothetical protein D8M06_17650 [Oceanobacillus halophilus]